MARAQRPNAGVVEQIRVGRSLERTDAVTQYDLLERLHRPTGFQNVPTKETKGILTCGTKPCPVAPRLSLITGARWPLGHWLCQKSSGCFENRFGQARMRANLSWARFPNLPLDFHRAFPHALVQMFASRWSDLRCARTNNRSASCRDTLNCKFGCARRGPLSLSLVFGRAKCGPLGVLVFVPSEGDGNRLAGFGTRA